MVPADAQPIVQALQGEMQVLIGFEFQHRQTAVAGHREQVEHAAIAGLKSRYLGVNVRGVKLRKAALPVAERLDIAAQLRFKPCLRCHAEERVFEAAVRVPAFKQPGNQFAKQRFCIGGQRGFVGSGAEGNFADGCERVGGGGLPDAREFKTVQQ